MSTRPRSILHEWVLQPQYLTAWLQALASIVALGISAWAVLRQRAIERRRDRRELNTLAVAIYPEIEMPISVQTVRERLTKLKATDVKLVGQSIGAALQASAYVAMPPMIERNIDRLYILGDIAGPTCIHLARIIIQYNFTEGRLVQPVLNLNANQWTIAVQEIFNHLDLLDKVIDESDREVRPIHDKVSG
jgi:hypothetical protein